MNLALKKISPAAARIQTLVARHAEGLAFAGGGGKWRVVRAVAMPAGGVTAYCRAGDLEITVWLDRSGWLLAAASVLACRPEEAADFPDPLRRAAVECFFSEALTALEKGLGQALALEKLEVKDSTIPASACRIALEGEDGLRIGLAWVAGKADDGWFKSLERILLRLPAARRQLPEVLPLVGVIGLGPWTAPASGLEGLETGDVVITPGGVERVLTVGGRFRFAARVEGGILSVEGKSMTQANAAPEANGDTPVSIDDARVELEARVGRMTVTLAQLRQLGEGQVVEFSTPVEAPVTLSVGGSVVATGELVDVGGRIGVRILGMAEK